MICGRIRDFDSIELPPLLGDALPVSHSRYKLPHQLFTPEVNQWVNKRV